MENYVNIDLKQHIGVAATPVVAVGEAVKKGQLIAACEGEALGANVHSSVYGIVTEICQKMVKIKMDENQPYEYMKIKQTSCHIEAVRAAGVVGAGGAGFPTHVKLGADFGGEGCVILNGAECEPVLGHNLLVLSQSPEEIVRGLKYAMAMTKAAKGYIAVKSKKIKQILKLVKICKDEADIEVRVLPDVYPVGDERVIVREILGVTLKSGQLPLAAGALVLNVETIKRVTEAIELSKPVITKDFTVAGRLNGETKIYLEQPIGMPIKKYIDECGGAMAPHGEILLGGPFTGMSANLESATINKTTGGIFVAMPFPNHPYKFGILACECGAQEARLSEIVAGMGGEVVCTTKCKRMTEINGRYRCVEPGNCPGQAEKILELKKAGATAVLTGSCED